jgi:hypothetical protein
MVTNTSVSLVTSITIWDLAMSGCSVNHSGWSVSTDGKEAMLIGGTTPFATTVTELTGMDMFSQGMTISRERIGRKDIDTARTAEARAWAIVNKLAAVAKKPARVGSRPPFVV